MKMAKLISCLLAASLAAGSGPAFAAEEPATALPPTGLRVDLREDPLGLDTPDPTFSWVVRDSGANEGQTAYRVTLSAAEEGGEPLLDTGWVKSNRNTGVHLPGADGALQPYSLYYWRVQTRNRAGQESEPSAPAHFMTGIGAGWETTAGIWPAVDRGTASSLHDYTLEQTLSVRGGGALGILGYMDVNGLEGYLLQVRNADNVVKAHRIAGGSVNGTPFATLELAAAGVTLPADASAFGVRIRFAGASIGFAFDTGSGYKDAGTINVAGPGNRTVGTFGYRTGGSESGTVDNIKVTDSTGAVVYADSTFADADKRFGGLKVSSGALVIPNRAYNLYTDADLSARGNFAFFRSPRLTVDPAQVALATVSLAVRGTAKDRAMTTDLFFNGQSLGVGSARELANAGSFGGATNYTRVYYNTFDVTPWLSAEGNVIAAVSNCLDPDRALLAQMTIFYKDGRREVLTNSGREDSGWRMLDGTAAFGDAGTVISTGYIRLCHDNVTLPAYPMGWQEVDYDDGAWSTERDERPVADGTTGTYNRVLTPYTSENTLRAVTAQPTATASVTRNATLLIDLGKEIIGGVKVDVDLPNGGVCTVHMGEEMEGDYVRYRLTATPVYEDTWTLQAGRNRFETVTMRTFRYIEIEGLSVADMKAFVDQNGLTGWAMMQPFDEEDGDFSALDGSAAATLLNRLYELSKYTIQATNQDVFVDSQARERLPYEGDLLVNANTSYAVSANYSLARHSNEWLVDNPTWPNDYSLFLVEMFARDLLTTGDRESVEEAYIALRKKLMVKIRQQDAFSGLIEAINSQAGPTALIDWPTSERDGYQAAVYDVIFNAEYVGIYRCMAQLAAYLGMDVDAEDYQYYSDQLKATLLEHAWDAENGCFFDSLAADLTPTRHSSVHATAYALTYGVFDSQEMADRMCQYVYERCKDQFVGSVYMSYFILMGLYRGGHGELAEALLTNPTVGTDVKTFASVLDDLNCTISPEAWGHRWKSNMTLSHPWGAAPGCAIVQGMFGINPTAPGYYTFDVKLQPGQVAAARLKAPSPQGAITVSYEKGEQALMAELTVPANTTARLLLPTEGQSDILLVDRRETLAVRQGRFLAVELGSGHHTVSTLPDTDERLRLTDEAAEAAALLDALPAVDDLTAADADAVQNAAQAIARLSDGARDKLSDAAAAKLAGAIAWLEDLQTVQALADRVMALPGGGPTDSAARSALQQACATLTPEQADLLARQYPAAVDRLHLWGFSLPGETVYGDVNADGSVNAADALLALQHSVRLITLTDGQLTVADVNGDRAVNAADALLILQKSVKLIDTFPVEAA